MRPQTPDLTPGSAVSARGALAVALAAAVLAGCPATPAPPDAGPVDLHLYSVRCSTAAECVSGDITFSCDPVRGTCVCTNDAACAGVTGKPWCNAFTGRCVADVAGCKGDDECGAGRFCDESLRTCRDKKRWCEACTVDDECGDEADRCVAFPGSLSSATFCAAACGAGDVCPDGQVCRDTAKGRQCLPAAGRCAGGSAACNPDSGTACQRDSECNAAEDQVCDTVGRRCVAARATCAGDQVCDPTSRACVAKCRLNDECALRYAGDRNWICVNNACVRALTCEGDGDCPSSTQWCFKEPTAPAGESGVCQTTCNGDEDCPLGQRCLNDDVTARRRCQDSCRDNAGCPLNTTCDGGRCVSTGAGGAQRCQVKEVCGFRQVCSANSCVTQAQHCSSCSSGCPGGSCVSVPYAAGCGNTSTTCAPKTCNLSTGGQLGCGVGVNGCYCTAQRCLVNCTNDSQCPNGFYCEELFGLANKICQPVSGDACVN
jgi:hypothetical protein